MTRAREGGDASVAARRLLVLAGALAGLWLVSWLTSGSAEAATGKVRDLPDAIGVVVGAVTPAGPREAVDAVQPPKRAAEGRAAAQVPPWGAGEVGTRGAAHAAAVTAPASYGEPGVALTEPVSRAAQATAPAGTRPAPNPVPSPAAKRATAVTTPLSQLVGSAAPVTRAVGAVVKPVAEPVTRAVGQGLSPLTKPVSHLVRTAVPVVQPITTVLAPVTRPVADLLGPLTTVLDPVTSNLLRPVLGAPPPVVGDLLTPVDDTVGRPVVAPVTDVFRPPVAPPEVALPKTAGTTAAADLRLFAPTALPQHEATAEPHRSSVAVRKPAKTATTTATAQARGYRPGPVPVHPGAPVTPDVAGGAGPTIPAAFLAAGHLPHHFRASPWAHGVFVPLWRPCEPGTGPG